MPVTYNGNLKDHIVNAEAWRDGGTLKLYWKADDEGTIKLGHEAPGDGYAELNDGLTTILAHGEENRKYQDALYAKLKNSWTLTNKDLGGTELNTVAWVQAFVEDYEKKRTEEAQAKLGHEDQDEAFNNVEDHLYVNKQTGAISWGHPVATEDWAKVNDLPGDSFYAKVRGLENETARGVALKSINNALHDKAADADDWRANFTNAYRDDLTAAAQQTLLNHTDKATLKNFKVHFNTSGVVNTQVYIGPTDKKPEGFGDAIDLSDGVTDGKTLYTKFDAAQKKTLAKLFENGAKQWQKDFVAAYNFDQIAATENIQDLEFYIDLKTKEVKLFNKDDGLKRPDISSSTTENQWMKVPLHADDKLADKILLNKFPDAKQKVFALLDQKKDWEAGWQKDFIETYKRDKSRETKLQIVGQKFEDFSEFYDKSDEGVKKHICRSHERDGEVAKDCNDNVITVGKATEKNKEGIEESYVHVKSSGWQDKNKYGYKIFENKVVHDKRDISDNAAKSAAYSLLKMGGNGDKDAGVILANQNGIAIDAPDVSTFKQQITALKELGVRTENIYLAVKKEGNEARFDSALQDFKKAMKELKINDHPYAPRTPPMMMMNPHRPEVDPGLRVDR